MTPFNYCDWHWHIIDPSYADDGFGNLVLMALDMFWFNVDRMTLDESELTRVGCP